ncbi:MAG: transketolase [Alphaproteobacteria bacterium]
MTETPASPSAAGRPVSHQAMANAIRFLSMDAVEKATCGHPGMPMGMADVATVLFTRFTRLDPADPAWPNRDRVVLSAGHGSMLLYSVFHLLGFDAYSMDQIRDFRQMGSRTPGHPEHDAGPGIETTTGPLGQGFATAVGMAIAERMLAGRFGGDLVDYYTYVLASDGDLMEGISHEAASIAGHHKLSKLIVLFDDNQISIDGPTSLAESVDTLQRFEACGWAAERIDGHDPDAVAAALDRARSADRPSLIACRTRIGFGAPTKEGKASSHGAALGTDEIAGARKALDWPHEPFVVPEDILGAWREAGRQHGEARAAWERAHAALAPDLKADYDRRLARAMPEGLDADLDALKAGFADAGKAVATRKASGQTLEVLNRHLPELVGGSADLTGSNNTRVPEHEVFSPEKPAGRFVHWGVREHAMTAAMNGMALSGVLRPFSGTFLVFSDFCRPSIRLAALMKLPVVHVFTHDSIGVGEDGPTHQPVEHLAALRAMPNLHVFRPADAIETVECWQAALTLTDRPSILALTRQNVPLLREAQAGGANRCLRGGYELLPAPGGKDGPDVVTLIGTGSELQLAVDARSKLKTLGIDARVVSLPCWELFDAQDPDYKRQVLGQGRVRIGVEAGLRFGWDQYLGRDGVFVGMTGFGASAPAPVLYEHFNITVDALVKAARSAVPARASKEAPGAGM